MKIESIVTIKKELQHLPKEDLLSLCLRLGKFKKENKALLTYLLFEAHDEDGYVSSVKSTLDELFDGMNTDSYFYMKKTIRKILRQIRTYSRYSSKKSTEVELLIYFCERLNELRPSIHRNRTLSNLYERQIISIKKKITSLHEDLQYDYSMQLNELRS
jgi:predicted nucleotide-binding protein (sugar kinase/HSP70/actin superfamily)